MRLLFGLCLVGVFFAQLFGQAASDVLPGMQLLNVLLHGRPHSKRSQPQVLPPLGERSQPMVLPPLGERSQPMVLPPIGGRSYGAMEPVNYQQEYPEAERQGIATSSDALTTRFHAELLNHLSKGADIVDATIAAILDVVTLLESSAMLLNLDPRIQAEIKKFGEMMELLREFFLHPDNHVSANFNIFSLLNLLKPNKLKPNTFSADEEAAIDNMNEMLSFDSDHSPELFIGIGDDGDAAHAGVFGDDDSFIDSESVLPGFPIPNMPNPADLPDNYSNSTHEVHVVNGTRVTVNSTTNKETEDGYNTFVHHQVIHIKPAGDVGQVVYVNHGEEFPTSQPEVEDEAAVIPVVPEVLAEVNVPELTTESGDVNNAIVEDDVNNAFVEDDVNHAFVEDDISNAFVEVGLLKAAPSFPKVRSFDFQPIRFPSYDTSVRHDLPIFPPGPLSASYSYHHFNNDAEDFENRLDDIPPPDLSGDTAVNRFPGNQQGMVMIEPDAEIFDFNKVVEDSNHLEFV